MVFLQEKKIRVIRKYQDFESMVFRMELKIKEILNTFDLKHINSSFLVLQVPRGVYEIRKKQQHIAIIKRLTLYVKPITLFKKSGDFDQTVFCIGRDFNLRDFDF